MMMVRNDSGRSLQLLPSNQQQQQHLQLQVEFVFCTWNSVFCICGIVFLLYSRLCIFIWFGIFKNCDCVFLILNQLSNQKHYASSSGGFLFGRHICRRNFYHHHNHQYAQRQEMDQLKQPSIAIIIIIIIIIIMMLALISL